MAAPLPESGEPPSDQSGQGGGGSDGTAGQGTPEGGAAMAASARPGAEATGAGTGEAVAPNANQPVPRGGPRGVNPDHHNANVTVRDANGTVRQRERLVSGNMTPEEQALGFPKNTLASHTEARAVRSMPPGPGETMTITGQRPPCPTCKGPMNRTAKETGGTIIYRWRENGVTRTWTAGGS